MNAVASTTTSVPKAKPLTNRQRSILDWVRGYIEENGYSPALRDIMKAFGLTSTNAVNDHLRAIERKGFIVRAGLKARAIRVVAPLGGGKDEAKSSSPLPIAVAVPAVVRATERLRRLRGWVPSAALTEIDLAILDLETVLKAARGGGQADASRG